MKTLFLVFLGGGIGSVFRYLVSSYFSKIWMTNYFPLGTLLVNILGCFIIGALISLLKTDSPLKFVFIIGFCGGFTTFSTFSIESINLWQNQQYINLFIYIGLSIILGFIATYMGLNLLKH